MNAIAAVARQASGTSARYDVLDCGVFNGFRFTAIAARNLPKAEAQRIVDDLRADGYTASISPAGTVKEVLP